MWNVPLPIHILFIFYECDVLTRLQLRMVTGLEVDKLISNKVDGEGREPKYAVS